MCALVEKKTSKTTIPYFSELPWLKNCFPIFHSMKYWHRSKNLRHNFLFRSLFGRPSTRSKPYFCPFWTRLTYFFLNVLSLFSSFFSAYLIWPPGDNILPLWISWCLAACSRPPTFCRVPKLISALCLLRRQQFRPVRFLHSPLRSTTSPNFQASSSSSSPSPSPSPSPHFKCLVVFESISGRVEWHLVFSEQSSVASHYSLL